MSLLTPLMKTVGKNGVGDRGAKNVDWGTVSCHRAEGNAIVTKSHDICQLEVVTVNIIVILTTMKGDRRFPIATN